MHHNLSNFVECLRRLHLTSIHEMLMEWLFGLVWFIISVVFLKFISLNWNSLHKYNLFELNERILFICVRYF